MDYLQFKDINLKSKSNILTYCQQHNVSDDVKKSFVVRISSAVNVHTKECEVIKSNNLYSVSIRDLVLGVCSGKFYLSNPSCLSNWDFNLIVSSVILYHGSPNAILRPKYGRGEDKHDYGRGLYLTPSADLAREWAVCDGDKDGYLYKIDYDLSGLKVLDFDTLSPLNWIAELMCHRAADTSARYRKLAPLFINKYKIDTTGYDIIKGWRADSSYFRIAKVFVRDELDVSLLTEALKLGDLGVQFCIKSERAFKKLKREYKSIETVKASIYSKAYTDRDNLARNQLSTLLESDRNKLIDVFSNYLR